MQVLIVYMILLAASLPISFIEYGYSYLFGVCLWFIVFVFGYTEPILMGIMLNMVSPPERSTAISVTTFMMMSFGLLPAPYVYGAIVCFTAAKTSSLGNENEHHVCHSPWGMRIVSFATIIGGISLFLSF